MRSFLFAGVAFALLAGASFAQSGNGASSQPGRTQAVQQTSQKQTGTSQLPNAPTPAGVPARPRPSQQQPKRILGVMPNYRAVSAGALPPPPTPKEAFMVATENSFDYSAFVFVGITSLLAEGVESHPSLGKGVKGFYGYYWRGFADKTDGDYMVVFALPTLLHEDERYYARGQGSIVHRGIYAGTRILITPNYHGRNTFNAAEIFGRGISQAISLTYYPSGTQTVSGFASKYAYALGRDALTNVFREFWPNISNHFVHHPPKAD